jgi:hypothetical protein
MATGTAGTTARHYHTAQVHYLRKNITFSDDGSTLDLGYVPAGTTVIRAGVTVTTAFNAGSTNVLDIGTAADTDGFATDLALGTVGVIVADEMATTNDSYCAADTLLQCVVDLTGTAATTGAGIVWVEYLPGPVL